MKKTLYVFVCLLILSGCNRTRCTKTIENLKAAIQGESSTCARYAAFATKAKTEGHPSIALLFEAVSKSEGIHAANQRSVLKSLGVKMEVFKPEIEVKSTFENIQVAIDGETYVTKTMYLIFFKDTKTEKVEKAETIFAWAYNTELKHLQLFQNALTALEDSLESSLPVNYAICPVCGNIYDLADLDARCAFCGTSNHRFILN